MPEAQDENLFSLHKMEEVLPFGDSELLIFETDSSRLRRDLILEAEAQGIASKDAKMLADRTRFSTELTKPKVKDNRDVLGEVVSNEDGSVDCFFSIRAIVEDNTHNLKNQTTEAKLAIIRQASAEIWRHERQHIIQEIKPIPPNPSQKEDLQKKMRRESTKASRIIKLTAVAGATAFFTIPDVGPGIGLAIGCVGSYISLKKTLETNFEKYENTPEEIDACNHSSKDTHPGRQLPFDIRVENTN